MTIDGILTDTTTPGWRRRVFTNPVVIKIKKTYQKLTEFTVNSRQTREGVSIKAPWRSSSSSSCRAASTDIPGPLSSFLPIVHRLWQVFRAISRKLVNYFPTRSRIIIELNWAFTDQRSCGEPWSPASLKNVVHRKRFDERFQIEIVYLDAIGNTLQYLLPLKKYLDDFIKKWMNTTRH